jgi:hypothetical protein
MKGLHRKSLWCNPFMAGPVHGQLPWQGLNSRFACWLCYSVPPSMSATHPLQC